MRVALAGYGIEGKASYEYWQKTGNEVVIADEREDASDLPGGVEAILGADAFSKLNDFDLIIRSPGVSPNKLPYGDKVWSATNEFFAKCPAPVIGVTGTKGKGTTCSFIASILKAAGKTVHLIGNIGTPALSRLPEIQADDIVVYEMSSFQLWDFTGSPDVAVILMIEPDHLNVHSDMNDYIKAKSNLVKNLKPTSKVYYYPHNELTWHIISTMAEADLPKAMPYAINRPDCVRLHGGYIKKDDDIIAPVEAIKLPGLHNIENVCAAVSVALNFTNDYKAIEQGIRDFTGLPHRLRFVDEISGIKFYDDSIATTPGSAMAAIRSFSQPKVIILGGVDKGSDYSDLIELCAETGTDVVAIGENRDKIKRLCEVRMVFCVAVDGDMREIVRMAMSLAERGGAIILSPAAASFDMFKSYADRGEKFVEAVKYWSGK